MRRLLLLGRVLDGSSRQVTPPLWRKSDSSRGYVPSWGMSSNILTANTAYQHTHHECQSADCKSEHIRERISSTARNQHLGKAFHCKVSAAGEDKQVNMVYASKQYMMLIQMENRDLVQASSHRAWGEPKSAWTADLRSTGSHLQMLQSYRICDCGAAPFPQHLGSRFQAIASPEECCSL